METTHNLTPVDANEAMRMLVEMGLLSPKLPLAAMDEIIELVNAHTEAVQTAALAITRKYTHGVN